MTEQPVDLETWDKLWSEIVEPRTRESVRIVNRQMLVNAYPALAAKLRALTAERDKARADLAEAVKVIRVFLGHDDRFQVAVGGNPIAVDRMLAEARALLSRLEEGQ